MLLCSWRHAPLSGTTSKPTQQWFIPLEKSCRKEKSVRVSGHITTHMEYVSTPRILELKNIIFNILGSTWKASRFYKARWRPRSFRIWWGARGLAWRNCFLSWWPFRSLWHVWSHQFVFGNVSSQSSNCCLCGWGSPAWVFDCWRHSLWSFEAKFKSNLNRIILAYTDMITKDCPYSFKLQSMHWKRESRFLLTKSKITSSRSSYALLTCFFNAVLISFFSPLLAPLVPKRLNF